MKVCPKCLAAVSVNMPFCEYCGTPVKEETPISEIKDDDDYEDIEWQDQLIIQEGQEDKKYLASKKKFLKDKHKNAIKLYHPKTYWLINLAYRFGVLFFGFLLFLFGTMFYYLGHLTNFYLVVSGAILYFFMGYSYSLFDKREDYLFSLFSEDRTKIIALVLTLVLIPFGEYFYLALEINRTYKMEGYTFLISAETVFTRFFTSNIWSICLNDLLLTFLGVVICFFVFFAFERVIDFWFFFMEYMQERRFDKSLKKAKISEYSKPSQISEFIDFLKWRSAERMLYKESKKRFKERKKENRIYEKAISENKKELEKRNERRKKNITKLYEDAKKSNEEIYDLNDEEIFYTGDTL